MRVAGIKAVSPRREGFWGRVTVDLSPLKGKVWASREDCGGHPAPPDLPLTSGRMAHPQMPQSLCSALLSGTSSPQTPPGWSPHFTPVLP